MAETRGGVHPRKLPRRPAPARTAGVDRTGEPADADDAAMYFDAAATSFPTRNGRKLEARASELFPSSHGLRRLRCVLWMTYTEYGGGNDVYKTTYQLYHASELGMGSRPGRYYYPVEYGRPGLCHVCLRGVMQSMHSTGYGQEELEDAFLG